MKKKYFYGIYGIQFINHGPWSDPELIWHGKSFNYYEVENFLWDAYKEECRDIPPTEDDFAIWVKKNASLVRGVLQDLMDVKCFYCA